MNKTPRVFTPANLYRAVQGQLAPNQSDVEQDKINNPMFVASILSLATNNPQHIQKIIGYDYQELEFLVNFFSPVSGKYDHLITVGQKEIAANIKRKGASRVDNDDANAPLWPTVLEVAFAKRLSKDLEKGYQALSQQKNPDDIFDAFGIKSQIFINAKDIAPRMRIDAQEGNITALLHHIETSSEPILFISNKSIPKNYPHVLPDHVYAVVGVMVPNNPSEPHILLSDPARNKNNKHMGNSSDLVALSVQDLANENFWTIKMGKGLHPFKKEINLKNLVQDETLNDQVVGLLSSLKPGESIENFLKHPQLASNQDSLQRQSSTMTQEPPPPLIR